MMFNSLKFSIFITVIFILYWAFPDKYKWIFILLSNISFYLINSPTYLPLLVIVILVSYYSAKLIKKHKEKKKALLIMSILILISILASKSIISIISKRTPNGYFKGISAPLGLSFYILEAIDYLIDAYRGKPIENHLGYYSCCLSFFPTVVSGPIEKCESITKQIKKKKEFNYDQAVYSTKKTVWGLFKKNVIADGLAFYLNPFFESVCDYTGLVLPLALILYAIQLYMDFSGYSDMATGIAGLLGFEITDNFKSPYFSKSIKEFWTRWHVSLSSWLKNNIYIPLGGNRKGKGRRYTNIIITFLISGLWHGVSINYLIWGLLHGLYQIVEDIIGNINKQDTLPIRLLKITCVFILTCISWSFFRCESFGDAIYVLNIKNMVTNLSVNAALQALELNAMNLVKFVFCVFVVTIVDFYAYKSVDIIYNTKKLKTIERWIIYILFCLLIIYLSENGTGEFIYYKF